MKPKFIDYYMSIAESTAKLSYGVRLKVGAVIVRDNKILATGYNGTPADWDNVCETKEYMDRGAGGWLDPEEIELRWPFEEYHPELGVARYRLTTKPEVLHAESNSLMKVARSTESSDNSTLFCTHTPCIECAKLMYQAGVKNVYFKTHYRDDTGLDFLKQGNVNVYQYRV
jgi:dCMP deaminase